MPAFFPITARPFHPVKVPVSTGWHPVATSKQRLQAPQAWAKVWNLGGKRVPKETCDGESRVALTPTDVAALVEKGMSVNVEQGAGALSEFSDEQYKAAGATIVNATKAFQSQIVLKVQPPNTVYETAKFTKGSTLMSWIEPESHERLLTRLQEKQMTVISMECLPSGLLRSTMRDTKASLGKLSGYQAVVEAINYFPRFFTGKAKGRSLPLAESLKISDIGSISPAKVLVIGGGAAGLSAAAAAKSMGASVRVYDRDTSVREKVESIGALFLDVDANSSGTWEVSGEGEFEELCSAEAELFKRQAEEVDIIISDVRVSGQPAPKLISKAMIESMSAGCVTVDLAAEAGGNIETTVTDDVFVTSNGVTCVGYTDMLAKMGAKGSAMFSTNISQFLLSMGPFTGYEQQFYIDASDPAVSQATVLIDGVIVWGNEAADASGQSATSSSSTSTEGSTTGAVGVPFKTAADAQLEAQRAAGSTAGSSTMSSEASITRASDTSTAGSTTSPSATSPAGTTSSASTTSAAGSTAGASSSSAVGSTTEPVRAPFKTAADAKLEAQRAAESSQQASFTWKIGAKLPAGSQKADGTVLPGNAEPQPDGTVLIPGMASIEWGDVTLPDGIKLSSILAAGGKTPEPVAFMPDGSRPSQRVGFGWSTNVDKSAVPGLSGLQRASFNWKIGAKLPKGSQRADGTVIPSNAVPQPDGTVIILGMASIAWDEVTLPDGIKLSSILVPNGLPLTPEVLMPNGTRPSQPVGFSWSDNVTNMSALELPEFEIPSFKWTVGAKLPPGSQKSDGTVLPGNAEPQPDGTVLIPGMASISWDEVTLPDGVKLDVLLQSGDDEEPTPEKTMPDGSDPSLRTAWAGSVYRKPSMPVIGMLGFVAGAISSASDALSGKPSASPASSKAAVPQAKVDSGRKQQQKAVLGGAKKSTTNTTLPKFNWTVGATLPPGSQKSDGTVLPADAEPQPDGTVLIPGKASIKWEDITLPDGMKLMSILLPSGKSGTAETRMPDGSKPAKPVGFGWAWNVAPLSFSDLPDIQKSSFTWKVGAKLPEGSQKSDGTVLPGYAVPQPDGTVLMPGMGSIRWEEVTLPDGINLMSLLMATDKVPTPGAFMPDGGSPSQPVGFGWSSIMETFSATDIAATPRPEFNWMIGAKLPPGSQTADGKMIPTNAEPQPDGTVKIPGMPTIKWEEVTLPDGIRLDGFLKPSTAAPKAQGKMPDGSDPAIEGSWIAAMLRKPTVPVDLLSSKPEAPSPSKPAEVLSSFNWIVGAKLPSGSQKSDGTVLPADAEPQPDGTVLIPGMPSIKWADVTLPDGIRLDSFVDASSTAPETQGKMPDGSKPVKEGSWIASLLSKVASAGASFNWIVGTKLPAASQTADGTVLPAGSEPQPDGTVKIPGMPSIKWEEVTLPDGIRLDGFLKPSSTAPKPQGKMPNGSKPAMEGSWVASLLRKPTAPVDLLSSKPEAPCAAPTAASSPSKPEDPAPSFNWIVGTKLPSGSQKADGTVLPGNAEPQPDGTVLVPGMVSIKWEEVTLPDGIRLDSFIKPSGTAPETQGKMPDGSKPVEEGSWISSSLSKLASADVSLPSFNWIAGAKLPSGSQTADGIVLPADAEPQPDGTVLVPGMPNVRWEEVTLPDGIRLDGFVDPSSTAPESQGKMPDGSKPVKAGSWISSLLSKVSSADASLPSFNWIVGAKLPAGSQSADGTVLPAGSEPQPDGTVKIPGMPAIKWDQVTLPDGIRLDGIIKPSSAAPETQGKMPDGSKPLKAGSWIASLLRKPTVPVDLLSSQPGASWPSKPAASSPSEPETAVLSQPAASVPTTPEVPSSPTPEASWPAPSVASESESSASFYWIAGAKLPLGSQKADGTVLPADAEPLPDGTVKIPGMPSIKWEDVTLPDGIRLDHFVKPSGTTPETLGNMPDGSKPADEGSWISSLLSMPATPEEAELPSFCWITGAKLPAGSQTADGSMLPANAVPQPDGTVLIPGKPSIKWEEVTLPDGIRLDGFVSPSSEAPQPQGKMPDGSEPAEEGSWIASLLSTASFPGVSLPTTDLKSSSEADEARKTHSQQEDKSSGWSWPNFGKGKPSVPEAPSLPEMSVPSFNWTVGTKLPAGCKMPDGTVLPADAEPQPDGTVLIPGFPSIKWDQVTLPDGARLDAIVKPAAEANEHSKESDSSKATKKRGWWWLKFWDLSRTDDSAPLFNWILGATLPPGSQTADGTLLPADAEPQPDGTVLIPGMPNIKWADVTLPDGIRLDGVIKQSGEAPKPAGNMPDGSKPTAAGSWTWSMLSKQSLSDGSLPSFNWILGAALPAGSQKSDGTALPDNSKPLPDGTVKIPGMPNIKWEDVTLPDGIRLDALVSPSSAGQVPQPAARMPNGSQPAPEGSWSWSVLSKPSMPDVSVPSFIWPLNQKLPAGCQMPDGTIIASGALPQPNGTVSIPGKPSIKWEEVTLPDGIRLDALVAPSAASEAPQPAVKMPDGSQPAPEGSWSMSMLNELSVPEIDTSVKPAVADAAVKPAVKATKTGSKESDSSKPANKRGWWWLKFWDRSRPEASAPLFNWIVGAKLPPGSQMADGTVLPAGSEPHPDGTVKIPGQGSIQWEDVTLPDGIRLDGLIKQSGKAPKPAGKMPDGSKPTEAGSWTWSMLSKPSVYDGSLPSFNWILGAALPAGSQTADGTVLPANSTPQPDGTVKIPGTPNIKWEEVTLPDGIRLDGIVKPSAAGQVPQPAARMPDGSQPAPEGSWSWSMLSKPSMPDVSVPSFNWPLNQKLPDGCQMPDGTIIASSALPQPDGTVSIPGKPSVKWDDVTLPDGIRLDAVVAPSAASEAPQPAVKMPDGSAPAPAGSWSFSMLNELSMPDVSLPSFYWTAGTKLPAGCQMPDGTVLPADSEPQPDGTVKIPGMPSIKWEEVTLPDGFKLDAVVTQTQSSTTVKPSLKMPDGSKPAKAGGWSWPKFGKPSVPEVSVNWTAGQKLPAGCQMPDGSVLPAGSEPQSDGTVKIPGMPSIKWEEVTLPDGCKLDAVVTQSGATTKPSLKMPDGSEPTGEASWPVAAGAIAGAVASVKGAISGGGVSVPASTLPAFDWSAGLQLPEGCQFSDGLPIPLGAVPLPDGSVKVPGEMPVRWHDVILPDGVNLDWLLTRPAEEEPQPAATMPDGSAPVALGAWSWFASAKPSVPELAFAGGAGSALAKGASGVAAGVASGSGGGAGGSSGGSGGGGSGGGSGSGAGGGSADDGSAPLGAPWLLLLLFLGAAAAYPTIRYVRQKGDISAEAAIKGDTSSQNAWEAFKGFVLGGLTAGSAAIGSAGSLAEDGFKGMQQSFGDFINGLGIGADAKKYDSTTTGTAAAAGAAATNAANQQACPAAEEDSAPGIVGGVTQFLQQATGTAAEGASASSTAGKGPKENSRGKGWWLYPLLITAVGVAAYIVVKRVSGRDDSSSAAAAAGAASGPAGGGRTIYKPPVPNPATSQAAGQTGSGSTQQSGSRSDVAAALGAAAGGAVASGATSQGSSVPGSGTNVPAKGPSGSYGDNPPPGYPSAGFAAAAATSQMPAESDLKAPEGMRDLPSAATAANAPATAKTGGNTGITGGNLTPEPTSGTPGSAAWVLPSPSPSGEGQSSSSTTSSSAHGVWKYTWVGDGPAPEGGPGTLGPDGMAAGWQCAWEGTGPAPKSGPGGDSAAGAVLYKWEGSDGDGSGPAPVGGPGGAASTTTSAYMYKWEGSGPPPPGGPGKPGPDGNIEGWSKVSWDGSGPMPAGFATPEMTTTKIMYKWEGAGPPPPGGPGKPGPDGNIEGWSKVSWDGSGPMPAGFATPEMTTTKIMYKWEGSGPPPPGGPGKPGPDGNIEGWSKVSWDGSGPMPAGFNIAETTETKIMYKWEGSGPPPAGGPGAEAMSSAVMYKWVGSGPAPAAGPGEPGPDGTIPGWQKVAWDGYGPMPAGISGPEGSGSTIMYKWEGSGPMPAGGPAAGAYTWSSTSVQGSTASGTRQQGGLGRILNFIPGLRRKGSSTEGVASTSGVSGAASTSARVSGQAVNVQMVGSGGSTQAEGAGIRSSDAKGTVSKLPPWAPIPLFLAVTATWQAFTGKEEKDDRKTKEKGILGGVKLPFLRRKKQTKDSSEVSAKAASSGAAASSGGGKSSWLGFKRNKAEAVSSPKECATSEDGSWWWNPWMLTVVGVAAYIVIKKTSQDGGSGSAGGAISAGAAAGLAGAAGSSTTRQLKIPEDSEVLANCQPGDPEYDRLMKKLERIEMLEKTLRQEHAETDDVEAARRQIKDMRQSLKRR